MRVKFDGSTTKIWASKNDTYDWAHRPGKAWPCSVLSGKSVFVELDGEHEGDLVDFSLNYGRGDQFVTGHELNAFIWDTRVTLKISLKKGEK